MSAKRQLWQRLPWLHPQRAEVLAALALAVRLHQPLAEGFARLAEADPSLQPWRRELDAGLRSGEPLGALLCRHRLLDKSAARRLDRATDPVAEFETLTRASYAPLRGVWLICWFPAVLALAVSAPLVLLQLSGLSQFFETVYTELGIKLPALTMMMLIRGNLAFIIMGGSVCAMVGLLTCLSLVRGLRHLPHLWWVEVRRSLALLAVIRAARTGADKVLILSWPASWLAAIRVSAGRQRRPAWDREWRTYRILTRWRAGGPGWRAAARAPTAAGVLHALGLVSTTSDAAELQRLEEFVSEQLRDALEPARAQAAALLMVGFAFGCVMAVVGLFLPFLGGL